jgi:glutathione S-transferase
MGWVPAPDRRRTVGYGCLEDVVDTLAGHLENTRHFCGETFSVADVYLGSQIGWGLQFGTLPARPALSAYWDRIRTRPALALANALDDELIPKG